jgi:hypothetical protein
MRQGRDLQEGVSSHGARVALWASTLLLAFILDAQVGRSAAIAAGLAGMAVVLFVLPAPVLTRLATAAAMTPAAVGTDANPAVMVLAALLVALSGPAALARRAGPFETLQDHLARARRRDERAHVLSATVEAGDGVDATSLSQLFRLTDTVVVSETAQGYTATAVVDDHRFDREGFERRLVALVPGALHVGWATFPEGGSSLDVLIEASQGAARKLGVPAETGPVMAPDLGPAIADGVVRSAPSVAGETAV